MNFGKRKIITLDEILGLQELSNGSNDFLCFCPTVMYHKFVRIRTSLRMNPTMAAGVTEKLWETGDIAALIEAEKPVVRGAYKKRGYISN